MAFPLPVNLEDDCTGMFYCFADWANTASNGLFWTLMLLGFVVAMFISTQRYGTPRSFGFAAFCGLIGAIWLATMQLIAWWVASIFIIVGALGIAVLIMNKN